MTAKDFTSLLPLIVLFVVPLLLMGILAFSRNRTVITGLSMVGLILAVVMVVQVWNLPPNLIGILFVVDSFSLFYTGLIAGAGAVVCLLAHTYFQNHDLHREEFSILLALAVLGAAVLTTSAHFVSLFLGLEILSVALYGMIGYSKKTVFH